MKVTSNFQESFMATVYFCQTNYKKKPTIVPPEKKIKQVYASHYDNKYGRLNVCFTIKMNKNLEKVMKRIADHVFEDENIKSVTIRLKEQEFCYVNGNNEENKMPKWRTRLLTIPIEAKTEEEALSKATKLISSTFFMKEEDFFTT